MSMMKLCGLAATSAAPAVAEASGPTGLGALNVPSFSQLSCQRASMSAARLAVYRNGSVAAAVAAGVVSLMILQAPSCQIANRQRGCRARRARPGETKKPLDRRGRHADSGVARWARPVLVSAAG